MLNNIVKLLSTPFVGEVQGRSKSDLHKHVLSHHYDKNADDLFHFILTMSDYQSAQDISQTIWLKLLENKDIIKRTQNLRAYLFSSARNAVIDEYRKQGKFVDLGNDAQFHIEKTHEAELSPNSVLSEARLKECFEHALLNLPFPQREAFCLQQEGFSLEDIASITACKKETVKTRLRYAKQSLQKVLMHADIRGES